MKRCGDCFYYYRGKCYTDDVYNVERDNRACEDFLNRLCADCNNCIWCSFHEGVFTCHKSLVRNRRANQPTAICHHFKKSKYMAFLDPRVTAPRRCQPSIVGGNI
jgi:hypothetical protein